MLIRVPAIVIVVTTKVSSRQEEGREKGEEKVTNAFEKDTTGLIKHCPHLNCAREDQYQQVWLKSKNGMVL